MDKEKKVIVGGAAALAALGIVMRVRAKEPEEPQPGKAYLKVTTVGWSDEISAYIPLEGGIFITLLVLGK